MFGLKSGVFTDVELCGR